MERLDHLLREYRSAPKEFQVTGYWGSYEQRILDTVRSMDLTEELRSGKHPILATFGFTDVVYFYPPRMPAWRKLLLKYFHRLAESGRPVLPYRLTPTDLQEMAYHHCEVMGKLTDSIPINTLEASRFGNPQDYFTVMGGNYTMPFLSYYLRYCFANSHIRLGGEELLVELGSGSGYQTEVFKKAYPDLTLLCFDLPAQIYLCEEYLTGALGADRIVGTETTSGWTDLSGIQKGKIHFFGNWQMPLLDTGKVDVFWNAASFGEMEPEVVQNYLSYVKDNAKWVYLLQARHGKETTGETRVQKPITLEDYKRFLSGYALREEQDAWQAHRRLSQSGGYFEGVWEQE